MKHKRIFIPAAIALVGLFSSSLWACSAMGPSTHAGKVMSVDDAASTFTILDMETMSPITFAADREILEQITGTGVLAIVSFTGEADPLTATGIELRQ